MLSPHALIQKGRSVGQSISRRAVESGEQSKLTSWRMRGAARLMLIGWT